MKKNYSAKKISKILKISYEEEEGQLKESQISNSFDRNFEIPRTKEKVLSNTTKHLSKLDLLKNYEKEIKNNNEKVSDTFLRDWKKVEQMRGEQDAPVDTFGVEYCSDPKQDRGVYKYQTLISLLLSSQTKDPMTYAVMNKLIKHGLTVENIIKTDDETLKEMIHGVSFHNNKTKFIKKLSEVLRDEYNSETPEKYEEIIKLPGIGPKMAHLYIQCVCDRIEGIAVDTHVHRICNRLKWTNNTKTPEHTRKELESWLPKKYWADINYLLVGFGQTICKAVAPKCEDCLLNKTCEFGINRLKEKSKSKKSKSSSKLKTDIAKQDNSEELLKLSNRGLKRKNSDILNDHVLSNKRKKK